jgi:NAD(P)H-dependent FMN reductase
MSLKLHTIITSTRPGRVGLHVAKWLNEYAVGHGGFDTTLVDIADFNLPIYDEPLHPRLQKYQHAHTKRWAESVNSADAFAFVTPEYNYGPSPALVNALNYVYVEWNYKPAGFVSYGGVSGGLRAVQAVKLQATTLKLVIPPEGVPIPNVMQFIDKDKIFKSNELIDASAKTMLDELLKWAAALKQMRG